MKNESVLQSASSVPRIREEEATGLLRGEPIPSAIIMMPTGVPLGEAALVVWIAPEGWGLFREEVEAGNFPLLSGGERYLLENKDKKTFFLVQYLPAAMDELELRQYVVQVIMALKDLLRGGPRVEDLDFSMTKQSLGTFANGGTKIPLLEL